MSDSSTTLAIKPDPSVLIDQSPPAPPRSKRDYAIGLAGIGFFVFPLDPNGKTPAFRGNWQDLASSDPDRVADLWTCPVTDAEMNYNIGIATGRPFQGKYLFAVDIDCAKGKKGFESLAYFEAVNDAFPPTLASRTASGGEHRLLVSDRPVGNSASKIGKHIDVKGKGGYIVAPGSTIDGKSYEFIVALPIAPAPDFIIQAIGEVKERPANSQGDVLTELDTDAAKARAIEWLTLRAPDNGTFKVVAKVKDLGIGQQLNGELVLEYWRDARNLDKSDEHILTRVANAYRFGQNAPGIAAPEAEFDAIEVDESKQPPATIRKGLVGIDWHEEADLVEDPFLIEQVMSLGAMVVTYGDSNVGKTFVALDQSYHIAAGLDWNGHKVKQGLVVYVAAEGGKGFQKRMAAYKAHHGAARLPFTVVPCPIDLQSDQADTSKLVKLIQEAEVRHATKCVLVVIDTLARAIAGGDENTAVDMSKFVGHCDRIRAATSATVNVIHHTGKDKSKGARGSSALRAATDTEIEVDVGVVRVTKQRDMDTAAPMPFELLSVEIGRREDGAAITSCVVNWIASAAGEFLAALTPPQQLVLDALDRLLSEAAKSGVPKRSVTPGEWVKAIGTAKGDDKGAKQQLSRVGPVLIQAGYVVKTSDNQYVRIGHE